MPGVYEKAAEELGWRWSPAFDGYINDGHRNGPDWKDYVVAQTAEDACLLDGVENDADAEALLRKNAHLKV